MDWRYSLCLVFLSLGFVFLNENLQSIKRSPASKDLSCQRDGRYCPFFVIGHRGAPYIKAENTIASFDESLNRGANSVEADMLMTQDGHVIIFHDRHPNELIALARQIGLEGLPFIPYVPDLGDEERRAVETLTLNELRAHYGYQKHEGILANIFTSGVLDKNAIIPTYKEFSKWAKARKDLEAVFYDIKFGDDSPHLAVEMASKILKVSQNTKFKKYLSTPYPKVFESLKKWRNSTDKRRRFFEPVIFDLEKHGAIQTIKDYGLQGILTGKTILRGWDSYVEEMQDLVKLKNESNSPIFPIISWTIDDSRRMYRLMQIGVDGIVTNRPRELARLTKRHFKDHSLVSKHISRCWQENQRSSDWKFCASGKEINPFAPIGREHIGRWVCEEGSVAPITKDIFGCNFLNNYEVEFEEEIDNSSQVNIWYKPGGDGTVVIAKTVEEYTEAKMPFILEYKQSSCHDGALNYDCEYKIKVSAILKNGKKILLKNDYKNYDSSFAFFSNVSKDTKSLEVIIYETDDGKIRKDGSQQKSISIPFIDGVERKIKNNGTFEGKLRLKISTYEKMHHKFKDQEPFSLEFTQSSCSDGFLNYDCEYKIKVEYRNAEGGYTQVENDYLDFDSTFAFFSNAPKDSPYLRVTLYETDDGQIHSSGEAERTLYLPLRHGSSRTIKSWDKSTFEGKFVLKLFNYDEKSQHSEADGGLIPHKK